MSGKLVFDIETIGEDFDALDETTQEILTRWIGKEAESPKAYKIALEDLKNGLGFSPLTGEIVAIGVLDVERNQGVVYYQAPNTGEKESESADGNIKFKPVTEKEMLEHFWEGAKRYGEFISFNGRSFDVPFLVIRSMINGVKISKDLLSNRYLNSQRFGSTHIDLYDQLTFYGASRPRGGGLHMWCRALDIKSPKADGVSGDDVAALFKEKRYLDIAKYNVGDLEATKALYERWREYLTFGQNN